MRNIFTVLIIIFSIQIHYSQSCSDGSVAESIVLDITNVNSAGALGSAGNSSGTICFSGGSILDVVGMEWVGINVNPIGESWCNEAALDFAGSINLTPAQTEGNEGPCNNNYSTAGLIDLDELGLVFGTDAGGCINWEAYETFDDNDGATADQTFGAGLITFYGCPPGAVLPIDLISFTAKSKEFSNIIEWQTALEINNDEMIVEKSDDLGNWVEIGREQSRASANSGAYYSVYDRTPFLLSYYRLKSIDLDGSTQYSDVISVQRSLQEFTVRQVGPNPIVQDLEFAIESSSSVDAKILIHTITGDVIYEEDRSIQDGVSIVKIDFKDFAAGIYNISVQLSNDSHSFRVLKQ